LVPRVDLPGHSLELEHTACFRLDVAIINESSSLWVCIAELNNSIAAMQSYDYPDLEVEAILTEPFLLMKTRDFEV
jgi:hypothetical protein